MNLIDSFVEVQVTSPENFLKVKETLTRIGVTSKTENNLYCSCVVLHKQGKYYIVHFKEMLALDGNSTTFSDEDRMRRNTICDLLEQWGLISVKDQEKIKDKLDVSKIKIIPYKEKSNWNIVQKYSVGKAKS